MSAKARHVLREALRLPPKARADIAGTLLRSLDEDDDPDVEIAWAAEIEPVGNRPAPSASHDQARS